MRTGGETGARTGRRLGYLFKHAERLMAELHVKALAPFDINARDLGVLLLIDSIEPASQQQIAQRLGVDRTTMVAIIDALEAKGIIARHPDTEDRRRNVVELTPAGQDILRQATAASDAAEAELLAPLSPGEGEQLRDLLARVLASSETSRATPGRSLSSPNTPPVRSRSHDRSAARLRPSAPDPL